MTSVKRIANRTFPSVFQAWNPAEHTQADPETLMARHDLVFTGPEDFGLRWNKKEVGHATAFLPQNIEPARAMRNRLLLKNPNLILLAEIRYHDADKTYLPDDSPFWQRDKNGSKIVGWAEGNLFLIRWTSPQFREQILAQAKAIEESGVFDGLFLDWWEDNSDRLTLIRALRGIISPDFLIVGNANDRISPLTAPYLNGHFMECYRSKTAEDWQRIETSLRWASAHLRTPRITALETWFEHSRADLNRMRATTTLSLTHSNGYCLFSDPNDLPAPDHAHDWYPFWNKSLGKARGDGFWQSDGTWRRQFEKGMAIYNPIYNKPVEITVSRPHRSLATGNTSRQHRIAALDGDILLPN